MRQRFGIWLPVLAGALVLAVPRPAGAQEVNGIWTDNTTKDLGDILKVDVLKGIKIRGWVEGYYVFNFNRVSTDVANAHQGDSAIKSRDLTIEGRTFDVHNNSLTWDLAEVEIEKVPARGGAGFKVDLAGGDVMDIIVDSI